MSIYTLINQNLLLTAIIVIILFFAVKIWLIPYLKKKELIDQDFELTSEDKSNKSLQGGTK